MLRATSPVAGADIDMEPVTATEGERAAVARIAVLLESQDPLVPARRPALVGPNEEQIELPEAVFKLLLQAVPYLERGEGVSIIPSARELTTQQAADLLNVSRQYVVRLLEEGRIPFTKTGSHRRIRLRDLLAFKTERDQTRRAALSKLTRLSREYGLYDDARSVEQL